MADEKPAVLQEQTFVVQEGWLYRAFRTGSILTNKLFFAALILLGIWLLWAYAGGQEGCAPSVATRSNATGGLEDAGASQSCNPFLSETSLYLGAMSIISFAVSILFGLAGLVVGKKVLQATPAAEEVGARRPAPDDESKPPQ